MKACSTGHVSMRHSTNPGRYLLSYSRSPELVQADAIFEFTLDSEPMPRNETLRDGQSTRR
jgi:hypothetical protein